MGPGARNRNELKRISLPFPRQCRANRHLRSAVAKSIKMPDSVLAKLPDSGGIDLRSVDGGGHTIAFRSVWFCFDSPQPNPLLTGSDCKSHRLTEALRRTRARERQTGGPFTFGRCWKRVLYCRRLAQQLCAEVVTLKSKNVAESRLQYARSRNVSKIVRGETGGPAVEWERQTLREASGTLASRSCLPRGFEAGLSHRFAGTACCLMWASTRGSRSAPAAPGGT